MPELGFLRGETGAGNSQNREPSAHCLGESENSKGLLEGGIAVGDVSLQALARCSISSSGACRGPGGVLVTPVPSCPCSLCGITPAEGWAHLDTFSQGKAGAPWGLHLLWPVPLRKGHWWRTNKWSELCPSQGPAPPVLVSGVLSIVC